MLKALSISIQIYWAVIEFKCADSEANEPCTGLEGKTLHWAFWDMESVTKLQDLWTFDWQFSRLCASINSLNSFFSFCTHGTYSSGVLTLIKFMWSEIN